MGCSFYLSPASLESAEGAEKDEFSFKKIAETPIFSKELTPPAGSHSRSGRFFLIAGLSAAIKN
jgi:hypothetical protein